LALAVEKYGMKLHAACAMSNHYHLVLTDPEGVLPDFTAWFNRQLAMCIKRLRKWDEVVWEPNVAFSAVELTGTSEVLDKVAYVLLNPVSAGLVRDPKSWPGFVTSVNTLRASVFRAERPSVWFTRRSDRRATLKLTTPTCFADRELYLEALEGLVTKRTMQIRDRMRRQRRQCLGRRGVRRTSAFARPATKKERFGRSPTFSALTRDRWLAALRRLRGFREAYRAAYDLWRIGKRDVEFPPGTWWLARRAGATVAA
jgi:REP element-mobilizing transposase RayT